MRILVFPWIFLMSLFQTLSVSWVSCQCLNDQRSLLLQLNNSLIFDRIVSTKLVNWNQNVDCCKWAGVACDRFGHVISLELDNEGITSGIENSSSLFGLRYLTKLNLAFNRFTNVGIPKGLQNLTNLLSLNLSNAGFVGQIPIELSTMRHLVSLDLSTIFTGREPLKLENPYLEMLVQNLTALRELNLDGVDISASARDWGQVLSSFLPDIRNLSLINCQLSGPMDPSLSRLRSLSVLRLDRNNLSSTVPDFFAKFSSLTILTLSSCYLQGAFPEKIFQVPNLKNLDLSNNVLLGGTIPQFPQNGSIRTLELSYTNFTGSLPESISNLSMLSTIDLSNCKFTGPIPSTITNLTELVHLDFSFNFFIGPIPSFYMSEKLVYIDLRSNSLMGSLSSKHFSGLSNLEFINLSDNSLNGSIPQSLFGLPSLQKLMLSNNAFSDQVKEVRSEYSTNLDTLDLSSNHLEGSIPKFFFNLERLKVLLLSFNFFSGTLNLEMFQKLSNLTRLELAYNNLTIDLRTTNSGLSQIPQLSRLNLASCNLKTFPDLSSQSKLRFLDLSNNQIMGAIPSWIWEIGSGSIGHLNLSYNFLDDLQNPYINSSNLYVLDLHSNKLHGKFPIPPASAIYVDYSSNNFQKPIPPDIGNFTSFTLFLSLANNSLIGAIPTSLCHAINLKVLDLSDNSLNGSIPPCLLRTNENLGVLNLGRNNISGYAPNNFSVNCGLKTLDLGTNNLGGKIPASLANCKSLEVMNVRNNKLDDRFPCMLKNLSSLRVLVLRSNRFYGDITCCGANQSWPNLQIIDIASNNFSGNLNPKCISSWKRMIQENEEPNHIRYNILNLNNLTYQDTVTVTTKGLEVELVKILTVYTSLDFSCNNFQGEIPDAIGELRSLYVLNLSHNSLTGTIPKSIGNLAQLGSLDLSVNHLTGEIPVELANLTFLSVLNLSNNTLFGRIPMGSQLQTFSAASYLGNKGLCGFPLNTSCDSESEAKTALDSSEMEFDWKFILTGLGYGVGAALIIAPVAFCKQWREQCNDQVEQFLKLKKKMANSAGDEFRLVSPNINDEGRLPRKYTDEGQGAKKNISPPLEWYNLPDGTRSLALIVQDIDAPDPAGPIVPWTVWVVVNIPPTLKGLPEGFSGKEEEVGGDYAGIKEGYNDLKTPGWYGPKLPSPGHRFEFKLYALDDELNLGNKVTKEKVLEAIEGHVLGEAVLMAKL